MYGHSFERICTKFGKWHRYALRWSRGLASANRSRGLALRAPSVRRCKSVSIVHIWIAERKTSSVGLSENSELAGRKSPGVVTVSGHQGLSYGVVFVILRLAILVQYQLVMDRQTERQTNRRTDMRDDIIYRAGGNKRMLYCSLIKESQFILTFGC